MNIVLDAGAYKPIRAHEADAGYDLFSRETITIEPDSQYSFNTGVHIQIPNGYVGFLKSKSGLNVNNSILSDGVIDSEYTGSIVVKLYNHSKEPVTIKTGQKISQIVFLPIFTPELEIVQQLTVTDRGENGFGSTGK